MRKILFIGVNYCSYPQAKQFVESINKTAEDCSSFKVDVVIADNTPENKIEFNNGGIYNHIGVEWLYLKNNLGYLGAALKVYNQRAKDYDYVVISNVDLLISRDFLFNLMLIDFNAANDLDGKFSSVNKNTAWIAPNIYTPSEKRHENPYMTVRPTKRNFKIWNLIYSNTFIYRLYHLMHVLKGWYKNVNHNTQAKEIYAGHGSFMLFTKSFINHYNHLEFDSFLYGEEIYLAELVLQAGLKVQYIPTLQILNSGHINTASISLKQKSEWSKQSLKMIYDKFFTKQ